MVWQVCGQDRAVSLLERGLKRGTLSHAYLLVGPRNVGKMTLAQDIARALNCASDEPPCGECASCQKISQGKHADVVVVDLARAGRAGEDKSRAKIGVEQIEDIQRQASLPPFEGRVKVFIIDGAELLSLSAANRLLKTLEEPEDRVVFVLLTTDDRLLPSTVVSRCQRLELTPLAVSKVESLLQERGGVEETRAGLLAHLCHGRLGWALAASADEAVLARRGEVMARLSGMVAAGGSERFAYAAELATRFARDRDGVGEVLALWLDYWRDMLLVRLGCGDIVTNVDMIEELTGQAERYSLPQIRGFIDSIKNAGAQLKHNADPRLVLEVLMLTIPERGEFSG